MCDILFEMSTQTNSTSTTDPYPTRTRHPRVAATLKNIYTDLSNPASYSSPYTLYLAAKRKIPGIKFTQVEEWLESKNSYTLYRRLRRKYTTRKVLARGIRYQYQADLVDYSALKRDNRGFTFILTMIDVFSRFAIAIPIKSKSGLVVANALEKAFKSMKPPKNFQTDLGKEFYNSNVKRVFKKYKINHFSTNQPVKAQIVERFNRILRAKIKRYMAENKTLTYVNILPDFLHGYNRSPHSAFRPFSPESINKNNEKQIHELQYGDYLRAVKPTHKYKIGDTVRAAQPKGLFSKSYRYKTFSDKLFEIVDLLNTNPPTYRIKDLKTGNLVDGCQYQNNLQRVVKLT